MPVNRKKKKLSKAAHPTNQEKLNEIDWEHRATDPADAGGTKTIPDRSMDYEVTTDYKRVPHH